MAESRESHNSEFVVMPWDDVSEIFIERDFAPNDIVKRWDFIRRQLGPGNQIHSVTDLIEVIKSYNTTHHENCKQLKPPWKFTALTQYFEELDESKSQEFFKDGGILETIKTLILQSPQMVPNVKLLKSGVKSTVSLHQLQIASLLANAFMCTYTKRDPDYPSINFNKLFDGPDKGNLRPYIEKIKCIIHYFRRINEKQPTGNVSFHRLCILDHKLPRWDKTTATLCDLQVEIQGNIEDQQGFLQMDFANRFVGGGVLGRGCVQEEIRFIICPELIAARLFTQCLADNEALLVIGAERYCKYTGFADSFRFDGDYQDATPFDETNHRKTNLVVLDALNFSHSSEQYRESKILRELKKAYVGFKPIAKSCAIPLATGNWGCGIFRGDPQLKSILQLMASSQARRNILYLTFGDSSLKKQIDDLYKLLKEQNINVGTLYRIIRLYNRNKNNNETLFQFIQETIFNWRKKAVGYGKIRKDQPSSNGAESPDESRNVSEVESERGIFEKRIRQCSVSEFRSPTASGCDATSSISIGTSGEVSTRHLKTENDLKSSDWAFSFNSVLQSASGNASSQAKMSTPMEEDIEVLDLPSPSLLSRIDDYYENVNSNCEGFDRVEAKLAPERKANWAELTGERHQPFQTLTGDAEDKNRKLVQLKITDCFLKK